MEALPFLDRADAGRRLAERLEIFARRGDVLVLALPRGGVAVGAEVARALGAPLDLMLVRKLGALDRAPASVLDPRTTSTDMHRHPLVRSA